MKRTSKTRRSARGRIYLGNDRKRTAARYLGMFVVTCTNWHLYKEAMCIERNMQKTEKNKKRMKGGNVIKN